MRLIYRATPTPTPTPAHCATWGLCTVPSNREKYGWFYVAPSSLSGLGAAPWIEADPPALREPPPGPAVYRWSLLAWSRNSRECLEEEEEQDGAAEGGHHPLLTSGFSAGRPCCPSPDCDWSSPALWPSRPAAHTLWRAARSCPGEPPAAWTGTDTHMHTHTSVVGLLLLCSFR